MVKNGIDCVAQYRKAFQGKRLGLVTSISGVNNRLRSSIEVLHKEFGLTALFAPEHGVRGNLGAGDLVEDAFDPYTNLPVYSLYRKDSKKLTAEMLESVDAVIYDIQDLGVRYYTYISTMLHTMEACAAAQKELIILDRLNPLGDKAEGNCLKSGYESFIGSYPLCMRYGLTVGELAGMVNTERKLGCRLTVIPCEGWIRTSLFPDTGNIWMMPSPNMPRFETALLYPGTCLFEGTNLSEGRGTAAPFEMIGASFVNAIHLVTAMNAKYLKGVLFSPAYFRPSASKFQGEECEGVHIHVTDPEQLQAAETGLELLYTIREMYGEQFAYLSPLKEGSRSPIELLFGSDELLKGTIDKDELIEEYRLDSEAFSERKKAYHIY